MIYLKQSTASQEVPLGYFVDSTDGNTEETGLTIANTDIKVWKCGATTLANKNSGGATHISNGIYYAVLDATDTDTLGSLVIFVHVSGALAIRVDCCVLAANVYDALIGGGDLLQVDVQQFGNTNATTSGGRPEVNTTHAAGTAWGSGAITAASIATDAIDGDAIAASAVTEIQAGLSTLDAAGVRSAVGLASANLDTQLSTIDDFLDTEVSAILAAVDTEVAAIKAVTDKLDTALELDVSVYRFTVNALEQAPAGGGGGSTDWTADERDAIRTILGIPGSGTTPADPSAGILDTIRDGVLAVKAKTDNLPADPADASDIAASFSSVTSSLATITGYLDTEVAAIKAKTDNLPAAPAAVGDIPTAIENADALLKRDWTGLTGEASYSALNALRAVRGPWATPGGVYTVYKEDGVTVVWTRNLGTDPAGEPITSFT